MRSRLAASPESSPMTAPRNMTSTRSHNNTSSSSSVVTSTTPTPAPAISSNDFPDLFLRADIDADRRLVHDEYFRLRLQPFGEQDLLLIASGKLARQQLRGRRRGRANAGYFAPSRAPSPQNPGRRCDGESATGSEEQIFSTSVKLGKMPSPSRSLVRSAIPLFTTPPDLPRGQALLQRGFGQTPRGRSPRTTPLDSSPKTGAGEASHAEHFAAAQAKSDILQNAREGSGSRPSSRASLQRTRRGWPTRREVSILRPTIWVTTCGSVVSLDRTIRDDLAVAHDGQVVATSKISAR